ncbi:MAG: lipopolysaccharide heptosyltransferase II [Ignavibacteriaceae bacterium]
MKINKIAINKILLIKPRGIGDIVLSTIVLDNLSSRFPVAEIHYLVEEFAKQSVENNPLIKKIHTMQKTEFAYFVARRIRKDKYDLIIDMWSNPRSAQITFLSGAKYRLGYSYRGRRYAYNIKANAGRGDVHSAEHNLELLKAIDVPITSKNIHYHINKNSQEKADRFTKELKLINKNIIGIIPSGGWESKRCDAEKWIEICRELINKFDVSLLLLWGPGDERDVEKIKSELKDDIVVSHETDVDEMAALINNCDVIIANDSGPMHIAAALNVPTLGLFGPTDPEKHGPYSANSDYIIREDLHCIICNKLACPYNHECMKELQADEVMLKVEQLGRSFLKRK